MMDEEEDEYNDFSYQPESIEESAVNSKSIKEINNEINSEKGYDDFDNTKEIEEELFHSIKEKITQKNEESKKEDYEDSAKIDDFIEKILNQQEDSNEKNEIIKKKSTQEEIQTQIDKSNSLSSSKSVVYKKANTNNNNEQNISKRSKSDKVLLQKEKKISKKKTNEIKEQKEVITDKHIDCDFVLLKNEMNSLLNYKITSLSQLTLNNIELLSYFNKIIDIITPLLESSKLKQIIPDIFSLQKNLNKLLIQKSNPHLNKFLFVNTEVTNYETLNKKIKHTLSKRKVDKIIKGKKEGLSSLRNLEQKRLEADFEKNKNDYEKIKRQIGINKELISCNEKHISYLTNLISGSSENRTSNRNQEQYTILNNLQYEVKKIQKEFKETIQKNNTKIECLNETKKNLIAKLNSLKLSQISDNKKTKVNLPELFTDNNNNSNSNNTIINKSIRTIPKPRPQTKPQKSKNDFDSLDEMQI